MKRSLALLALAGLALTGCSSPETPAPAAAPTTSAPATATVAQYIAGTTSLRRDLNKWNQEVDEMPCGFGSLVVEEDLHEKLCALRASGTENQSEIIILTLEGLSEPKAFDYVGPVPADLETSVKKVTYRSGKIKEEAQTVIDKNCIPTLGCAHHFRNIENGLREIADELDSWSAYNNGASGSSEQQNEPNQSPANRSTFQYVLEGSEDGGFDFEFGGDSELGGMVGAGGRHVSSEDIPAPADVSVSLFSAPTDKQVLRCTIYLDKIQVAFEEGTNSVTCRASSNS